MVVDASVMVAWLINEPHLTVDEKIYQLLAEQTISVPAHWPVELGNALAINLRRGRIDPSEIDAIENRIRSLHVVVAPAPGLDQIATLVRFAAAYKLTVYDASYVLLANEGGFALATLDDDMRSAARRLNVVVLPA